MSDDPRCCGTGTCIINAEGQCWCGQRWDGEKMCFASESQSVPAVATSSAEASLVAATAATVAAANTNTNTNANIDPHA